MLQLNLGGGEQKIEGFLNVDLCDDADVKHDLRTPLPYKDETVDEIIAIHVIESFNQWEFPKIIKDWYRVLRTGGKLTIEFTVLSETIKMYLSDDPVIKQRGHWGLYGNQEKAVDPIVLHHYVYEVEELKQLLERTGFSSIEFSSENINHCVGRDMRVICIR